jgi:C_GCAxxG_C_C family probable redox protein
LNCAQAVIEAYSKSSGLDPETAKAVSTAFGGGISHTRKTCGAVTGAIMAIGCRYYDNKDIDGSTEKAYEKTREFLRKFEERHGSSDCISLLGVDLHTDDGREEFRKKNMAKLKCFKYLRDACDILEECC